MSVDLAGAVARLEAGGLVAYPTETVWGLAADSAKPAALAALRAWKGREAERPMAMLATGPEAAELPEAGRRLAEVFWPGPLTIVAASGGWRCSSHPVAAALAGAAAAAALGPLTATSLNRSGEPPATNLAEAHALCAGADAPVVLDPQGADAGGAEPSSVVDVTARPPEILREGAIAAAAIRRALAERRCA